MINIDKVSELVNYLIGSSCSLDEAIEYFGFEDLTLDELGELDSYIFCCDGCGWWYSIADAAEDDIYGRYCNDCANEEEEGRLT